MATENEEHRKQLELMEKKMEQEELHRNQDLKGCSKNMK